MIEIRTHPHTDEHGVKTLQSDTGCKGTCVRKCKPRQCKHYRVVEWCDRKDGDELCYGEDDEKML